MFSVSSDKLPLVIETIVIKYGGNAMKSLALRRAIALEIAGLRRTHRVVVVHGGGPIIERDLERLGITSQFLRGLRVTTPAALEVIEKAGSWFSYMGERIGQGKEKVVEFIKAKPSLEDEMRAKVFEAIKLGKGDTIVKVGVEDEKEA